MKYMLDTNICIYVIKEKPESVIRKFLKNNPEKPIAFACGNWTLKLDKVSVLLAAGKFVNRASVVHEEF